MTITVERSPSKQNIAGYEEFIRALELTYNLKNISPGNLRWVGVEPIEHSTPRVRANIAPDHPHLSVILKPENEQGQIMREGEDYHAPMLISDVGRWGQASGLELKSFKIDRWKGRPGPETMFSQPRSLKDVIERTYEGRITDTTPVIEVVTLLPIAENGEFRTEFTPILNFDLDGHQTYEVGTVAESGFSVYRILNNDGGGPIRVRNIDEKQKAFNWSATAMPDLSDMERLMVPSNHGHMVIIANPIEPVRPTFDPSFFEGDYGRGNQRFGFGSKGGDPMLFSSRAPEPMRGASISGVTLGRGAEIGQMNKYEGEVKQSKRGHAAIYHIRFLGVKPSTISRIGTDALATLGDSLRSYERHTAA